MKKKVNELLAFLAVVAMAFASAHAETYYLRGSDASGKSSFVSGEGGTGWALTPGGSTVVWPSEGNDYVVWVNPESKQAVGLRTPAKGNNYTFAGDSLTLESYFDEDASTMYWATLITKIKSSKTVTVANMTLKNGRVAISDSYSNIGTPKYSGGIAIPAGYKGYFGTSGTETDNRRMDVNSSISGAGDIVLEFASGNTYIGLGGDNSGLTGRIYIDHDGVVNTGNQGGGRAYVNTAASWPSDRLEADPAGVTINGGGVIYFNFAGTLATGVNRGFTVANKAAGFNVADGCSVTIEGPVSSDYGFAKTGAGTLALAGDGSGLVAGATVSATDGTLVLACTNAVGNAALSVSGSASLVLDVTSGAICLGAAPAVAALTVKATSVTDATRIPIMRLPSGSIFDASQVAFTYQLPVEVDTSGMSILSAADGDEVVVYLGIPAANLPTVSSAFKSVSSTSATYTLTLGYAGDCSDPLVVTAYYGANNCSSDKASWDSSYTFDPVSPGTADFTVPGLSPESSYFVTFMVASEGGSDEVWTVVESLSTASIVASAPESVFESDMRGVTVTFSRASTVAANALVVSLGYSGDTDAFVAETLAENVVFAAGETTATLTLKAVDNDVANAARSIVVSVQQGSGYVVGAASSVTIAILDDDSYVAADCVWTGASDLSWSNPGNWQGSRVPTMLDTAVLGDGIAQDAEISVDARAAAGKLLVPATVPFKLVADAAGGALFLGGIERPAGAAGTLDLRVPVALFGTDGTNRWNLAEGTTFVVREALSKAQDPLVVEKTGAGIVEMRKDSQTYNGPWVIRAGTVRAYGSNSFAGKAYVGGDETLLARLEQQAKPAFGSSINPVIYTNGTVYATGGVDGSRVETMTIYSGGTADLRGNIYCKEQIYYGGSVAGGATFYLGYGQKTTVHESDIMARLDCTLRLAGGSGYGYTFSIEDGPRPVDFLMTRSATEGQSDNNLAKSGPGTMKTTQNWGSLKNHVKINAGTWYVDNPGEYGLGIQETTVAAGAKLGGTGCVGMKDAKGVATLALSNGSESNYATLSPGTIDETTGAHIYGTFTSGRSSAHNRLTLGNWAHLEIGVGPKDPETKLSPADKLMVYGNLEIGSNCTLDLTTNSAALDEIKGGTFTIVEADAITGTFATVLKPNNSWQVVYVSEEVDNETIVKRIDVTVPIKGLSVVLR